jgi:photosystem II stability/assembly factor-like uncharacterized protein
MAEETLRRNLDSAFDPGPDFPHRLLLGRTMAMLEKEATTAGRDVRWKSVERRLRRAEPPRLMVFTAALLAIAIIITLVLTAHALHFTRSVPVKPGPPGGVQIHSVSVKPGPPGGIRDAIPIQPAVVLQCSAPSATYGCNAPSAPVFVTSSVGWTTAGSAAAEGPTNLYRTDDGGQHWFAQLSWDYSEANEVKVSPDGREALIITEWGWQGPALFHTTDGGSHWTSMGFPLSAQQAAAVAAAPPQKECKGTILCGQWPGYFPRGQIYFLNPREGWVLSQEPTFGVADLFHSTDSGAHWALSARIDIKAQFNLDLATGLTNPLPTPLPSGKGGVVPVDHELHGQLVFQDSSAGWFIPDYNFYPAMSLSVFRTLDRGGSWKLQTIELPQGINSSNAAVLAVKFFDDRQGVLELNRYLSGQSYAYTTSDGGTSWSQPNPIPTDLPSLVDFIDAHDWLAFSSAGALIRTSDGGQHWNVLAAGLPASGWQRGVFDFVDLSHGWVYTGYYLFGTTDGGVHWVTLTLPSIG